MRLSSTRTRIATPGIQPWRPGPPWRTLTAVFAVAFLAMCLFTLVIPHLWTPLRGAALYVNNRRDRDGRLYQQGNGELLVCFKGSETPTVHWWYVISNRWESVGRCGDYIYPFLGYALNRNIPLRVAYCPGMKCTVEPRLFLDWNHDTIEFTSQEGDRIHILSPGGW